MCIPLLDSVADGEKRNESLINITWHLQTKTKDYGTTTKIRTRTLITNASATQVIIVWPMFLVVEPSSDDLPLSKLSPFAVQKGSRRWPEHLKALKG